MKDRIDLRAIVHMPELAEVITFAKDAHENHPKKPANRYRKDGKTEYWTHPLDAAARIYAAGCTGLDILRAAILHDVLEDTTVDFEAIETAFGPNVAAMVAALTKDYPSGDRSDTRRGHMDGFRRASVSACLIKMADRLSNLDDWVGMSEDYRKPYAIEGLRILVACLDNQRARPYTPGFEDAWAILSRKLAEACFAVLFWGRRSGTGSTAGFLVHEARENLFNLMAELPIPSPSGHGVEIAKATLHCLDEALDKIRMEEPA